MNILFYIVIFAIIIVPLSLLCHEIGHAIGAKLVKASHITLTIGLGRTIFQRTYKNITFIIRIIFLFHSVTKTSSVRPLTKKEMVVITVMGPITSLVLSIIAYLLLMILPHPLIGLTFLFNAWLAIVNLLPFKFNERQSDGYTILQTIKNK